MSEGFSIINLTRNESVPSAILFVRIARAVLGARFSLCLVFAGAQRMRVLNHRYRGKVYVPNVLAFRMSKTEGEIFICPVVAEREARRGSVSIRERIAFLFIHGLLHLKGYRHGATMERQEQKFSSLLYGKTHRVRH